MLGTWSDTNDDSVRANRPRIDTARNVADAILSISSATNGKLSQKSYEDLEEQTGMPLKIFLANVLLRKFRF